MSTDDLQNALELLRKARNQVGDETTEEIDEFIEKMEQPIVKVRVDSDPMNPRKEFDNVGVMFCKHRRYTLGDEGAADPFEEIDGSEVDGRWMTREEIEYAVEILTAEREQLEFSIEQSDHNIIEEFGDWTLERFDSVLEELQLAWEDYKTRNEVRSVIALILPLYLYDHSGITISHGSFSDRWDSGQVGWHYVTKEYVEKEWDGDLEKAKKYLEGELKEYDQYLRGNVWGFTIETRSGEHIDSCWGFYGDELEETGMLEYVEEKCRPLLEAAWENRSYE